MTVNRPTLRRPHVKTAIVAIVGLVVMLTACARMATSTSTQVTQDRSEVRAVLRAGPSVPNTLAPTGSADPADPPPLNLVTMKLNGLPALLKADAHPIEFTAVLSNHTTTVLPDVAPIVSFTGGPCRCISGSLERYDTESGTWQSAPMPEGTGASQNLPSSPGHVLQAGASVTVRFRITVDAADPGEHAIAAVAAVTLPDFTEVGSAVQQVSLTS